MAKTRIFKVTVCYEHYHNVYHVSAPDDVKARQQAVRRWTREQNDNRGPMDVTVSEKSVKYCEIVLLAETD